MNTDKEFETERAGWFGRKWAVFCYDIEAGQMSGFAGTPRRKVSANYRTRDEAEAERERLSSLSN